MLSIFSVPVSSSKSPLHPGAEPPDTQEARIRPGFLPLLWGVLAVVVQARLCHRQGAIEVGPAIVALISVLALILAGLFLHRQRAIPQVVDHTGDQRVPDLPKSVSTSARWPILLLAGVLVSFAAGFLFVLWTAMAAVLLLLSVFFFRRLVFLKDLLRAILAGALFLGTATAMGDTLAGGYPAALAFFFLLAWTTTIAVECHKTDLENRRRTLATILGPRVALAVAGGFSLCLASSQAGRS
ncbi:MAG: hypothetical protein V1784_04825 [bacterium]